MSTRRTTGSAGLAAVAMLIAANCGTATDDEDGGGDARSTTPTMATSTIPAPSPAPSPMRAEPDEPAPCEAPELSDKPLPINVAIAPIPEPIDNDETGVATSAVVTNTSDSVIHVHGEGDEVWYGHLVDADETVVSAWQQFHHEADPNPELQPGESREWPVWLHLERCGGARGEKLEPGEYQMRLSFPIARGDATGYHRVTTKESTTVKIVESP